MTTLARSHSRSSRPRHYQAARALTVAVVASVVAVLLSATPALADVPEGWSNPDDVSWVWLASLIFLAPLGLAAIISLLVLAPGAARSRRSAEQDD